MAKKTADEGPPGSYDELTPYTQTIIVPTNWRIDLERLFWILPITTYVVVPKKRGRKPKIQPPDPNKDLKGGSIITLLYRDMIRGVNLKNGTSRFKNSINCVLFLDKQITFKIPKNGKFQFTGCRSTQHAIECLRYLWYYAKRGENSYTYEDGKCVKLPPIITTVNNEPPLMIFQTVMSNVSFNVGFKIDRKALDAILNEETEFASLNEPGSNYVGVISQIHIERPKKYRLLKLQLRPDRNAWGKEMADFEEYYKLLSPKSQTDERNRDLKITFMSFVTGSVIESGLIEEELAEKFNYYMNIIYSNRDRIEAKIRTDPVKLENRPLGEGSYAKVYSYDSTTAYKLFKVDDGCSIPDTAVREADIYSRVKSPYLLPFRQAEFTPDGVRFYLQLGTDDLHTYGKKIKMYRKVKELPLIIEKIFQGLAALHEIGIIHRDIKGANFILNGGPSEMWLADFSISTSAKDDWEMSNAEVYRPPEVEQKGIVTPKADIYAAGKTLITFLTGSEDGTLDGVTVARKYKELIADCTNIDYTKRPTAREILLRINSHNSYQSPKVLAFPEQPNLLRESDLAIFTKEIDAFSKPFLVYRTCQIFNDLLHLLSKEPVTKETPTGGLTIEIPLKLENLFTDHSSQQTEYRSQLLMVCYNLVIKYYTSQTPLNLFSLCTLHRFKIDRMINLETAVFKRLSFIIVRRPFREELYQNFRAKVLEEVTI